MPSSRKFILPVAHMNIQFRIRTNSMPCRRSADLWLSVAQLWKMCFFCLVQWFGVPKTY